MGKIENSNIRTLDDTNPDNSVLSFRLQISHLFSIQHV